MSATITIRGQGTASATPDDAVLTLTLSAILVTPEDALADVTERARELKGILNKLGIPEKRRTTTGVTVRAETQRKKDEWVHVGYNASTSVVVRVEDPDVLGKLMTAVVNEVDAGISGPTWRVALDNPAHTEARKGAIADARRRADAYSEALGVRLGAVQLVSEPGMQLRVQRLDVAYSMSDALDSADMEVEAGDVDVSAAVEVVYAITQ